MAKKEHIATLFEKVRERVTECRNQQDLVAIQKAEATVEYGVSITLYHSKHPC